MRRQAPAARPCSRDDRVGDATDEGLGAVSAVVGEAAYDLYIMRAPHGSNSSPEVSSSLPPAQLHDVRAARFTRVAVGIRDLPRPSASRWRS